MDANDPSQTFAATPPLEALRFMLSKSMTGPRQTGAATKVLGFFDISRAHFHSPARRRIIIKTPREDGSCTSGFGRLLVAMYGTKDAAQCFDAVCEGVMTKLEFTTGIFNPCLYFRARDGVAVFRHGDDFVVHGTRSQIETFRAELSKHLLVKHLGNLGPSAALGDKTEVRMLNRILRWVDPPYGKGRERIEYEADPRHAEIILDACGLAPGSRGVTTPGEKHSVTETTRLSPAEHSLYRSQVMRLAYLAQDRPELQHPSKELARRMQAPEMSDWEALKRVGRFLLTHPRCVQEFVRQIEHPKCITVCSDSDHAGCQRTRKSTSSSKLFHGQHMLRSTSTTQAVISLSTGESEFYGIVKATSAAIGAVAMLRDLGVDLEQPVDVRVKDSTDACIEVQADASAGIGIAMRRGAGKIRHIATPTLWVQKLVGDRKVILTKIPGTENCADLGTKHLDIKTITRCLLQCGYKFVEGRSSLAFKATLGKT